ncbi:hypothetical protein DIC66_17380 [Rhodoferax lacus]|uniref:Right handed beta helix domain-containing protein n=1 Tax=Rhodoferax lacus TaxID=2184758 RepID=A0A3E1R880_9BURK|nr:hypothetical protein DIC66_17380 [Rhodoferax lacus]
MIKTTCLAAALVSALCACGGGSGSNNVATAASAVPGFVVATPAGLVVGNPGSSYPVPVAAQAVDTRTPNHVVGNGTAASCTGAAVVAAVAQGGIITFSCGPDPITITLTSTAKVFNSQPNVTLDGGGRVTLSGGGTTRILYQNTCDAAQGYTTAHCQNQDAPTLTVQNLAFSNGNATGQLTDGGGGGAIFVRGGRFKIVNAVFINNQCEATGPDVGGGAVRVLSIYNNEPVYVVGSTFGGATGLGNFCSNGGALSGIGVSYSVYNSLFTHNRAIGNGANPARTGTPGGGSGGAIYNDGNSFALQLFGSTLRDNSAVEGGGAVFYVSNDRSGTLSITNSVAERNPNAGFFTVGFPGFFILAAPGQPVVSNSTLSP